MNTLTHALLPVLAAGVLARISPANDKHPEKSSRIVPYGKKAILLIALAGAAPDLLTPHLSLEARYSSWSHSIFAWLGISFFILLLQLHPRSKQWIDRRTSIWCSAAYALHLISDAISGGIAWLYPWKPDVIGDYYVNPIFWIPLDVLCFLGAYFLYRVIPRIRQNQARSKRLIKP